MYIFSHHVNIGDFHLSVIHCVQGLVKAIKQKIFNWTDFNRKEYEKYERVENGDLNWIIDHKLLAFSGPYDHAEEIDGIRTMEPEDYIPVFQDLNVGTVIRLNRPTYLAHRFTDHGISHHEIYFPDGGLPDCTVCFTD